MCLTQASEAKKASKNIIVFKELNSNNWSTNYMYKYKLDEVCPRIDIYFDGDNYRGINKGYHSQNKRSYRRGVDINSVFVIPKGTIYYDGNYNDDERMLNRASETIIYLGRTRSIFTWIKVLKYKLNIK